MKVACGFDIVSFGRNDNKATILLRLAGKIEIFWDVGARDECLREAAEGMKYISLDIDGNPDIRADISEGIPVSDAQFDCVVAFDVLEHVDNIHTAFAELCRVSRRYVLVHLPNLYIIHARLRYLVGKRISGKYGLSKDPVPDRHRWLFTLAEARDFFRHNAVLNGFIVQRECYSYYRPTRIVPNYFFSLLRHTATPGLWAWGYLGLAERESYLWEAGDLG